MLQHGPGELGLVLPFPSPGVNPEPPRRILPLLAQERWWPRVAKPRGATRGVASVRAELLGGAGVPLAPWPQLFGSPPARPRSPWSRRMLRGLVWGRSHIPKLPSCAPNRPHQPFLPARGAQPASPMPQTPPDSPHPAGEKPQNHTTRPLDPETDAPGPCPPTPPPHPHLPKSLLQLQVERALLHHRLLHPPARSILPRSPRTTRTPPSAPFFCVGPVVSCPPRAPLPAGGRAVRRCDVRSAASVSSPCSARAPVSCAADVTIKGSHQSSFGDGPERVTEPLTAWGEVWGHAAPPRLQGGAGGPAVPRPRGRRISVGIASVPQFCRL